MHMCKYVCMYVYSHVCNPCICIYTGINIDIVIDIDIYVYMYIYIYMNMYVGWRVGHLGGLTSRTWGGGWATGTLSHLAYWNLLHKILDVAA